MYVQIIAETLLIRYSWKLSQCFIGLVSIFELLSQLISISGKNLDEEMELVEDGEQHECVICMKKEESSENSPIGLIVLMQPSTSNFNISIF